MNLNEYKKIKELQYDDYLKYLTKKEKKQLDDYCFLEFEERII